MKAAHLQQKILHALRGVKPSLHKAARYWQGLTARERKQVLLMSAILAGALAWLFFTRPALKTLNHWQQELPRLRSQQAALQTVLAEVGGASPSASGTPQARLAQSLSAAGLSCKLHAEGQTIMLACDQPVEATTLINGLLTAPALSGMRVTQATIARVKAEGARTRVTASVMLAEQQQGKGE